MNMQTWIKLKFLSFLSLFGLDNKRKRSNIRLNNRSDREQINY
jgi:hypothetical protein